MADFEIIEDVGKAIPKGKDLKKLLPFIIAGAGLGLVVFVMNRGKTPTETAISESDGVGSDTDLGGVLSDFSNQVNQALQANNQEMSYQLSEVAGNLFDVVSQQNDLINQLQQQLDDQISNSSTGVSGGGGSAVYPVTTSAQTATGVSPFDTSGSSIYFDGIDDDVQYNTVVNKAKKAVSEGKVTQAEADKIKKEIAGFGNNGVGWTPESGKESKQRLASDPSYVESEKERTKLVIENREKAGLDTTAQKNYLSRLESGAEWKNP